MAWEVYTRGTIPPYRLDNAIRAVINKGAVYNSSPTSKIFYHNYKSKLWFAWDKEEIDALGKLLVKKISDDTWWDKHLTYLQKIAEATISYSEYVRKKNFQEFSRSDLVSELTQLYEKHEEGHAVMDSEIDAIDLYPTQNLYELLRSALPSNLSESERATAISDLCASTHTSYPALEERAVLILAKRVHDSSLSVDDVDSEIGTIVEQYWWTSLGWESLATNTHATYKQQIREILRSPNDIEDRIAMLQRTAKDHALRREELFNKYKLDKEIISYVQKMEQYIGLHDLRKEMQVKGVYAQHHILKAVATELDEPVHDLEWLTVPEIISLLQGTAIIDTYDIEGRIYACTMIYHSDSTEIYTGAEAIAVRNREIDSDSLHSGEVRGMAASPGTANGVAKVCAGAAEALEKVQDGDILVCGMTLPEYVPAMRKAAAIVTDEGGITCHAAIISRELGKPCIIGTKVATQAFSDGDHLEVNADEGTVRKIG